MHFYRQTRKEERSPTLAAGKDLGFPRNPKRRSEEWRKGTLLRDDRFKEADPKERAFLPLKKEKARPDLQRPGMLIFKGSEFRKKGHMSMVVRFDMTDYLRIDAE